MFFKSEFEGQKLLKNQEMAACQFEGHQAGRGDVSVGRRNSLLLGGGSAPQGSH